MDLLEAIILGIVQGATEFLPVSSSGHLVLVSWWLNLNNPPLTYTVMVHLGTTAAVLVYFWQDWWTLLQAGFQTIRTRSLNVEKNPERWLLFLLLVGTLPAAFIGFFFDDFFEEAFSDPKLVSLNLLVTAGLLVYGERAIRRAERRHVYDPTRDDTALAADKTPAPHIGLADAVLIGFAQALAIMPGISRSGSTIAAGMSRGLDRYAATRYSFLLSTPIILGAGFKQGLDLLGQPDVLDGGLGLALLVGFVVSAVVGYACIMLLLNIVRRYGFYGFAGYCVLFGLVSLGGVLVRG